MPRGGRRLEVGTQRDETQYVLARLGVDGPIIASVAVHGFRVHTAEDTWVRRIEQHEDGSQTVGVGLLATPLPDTAEIRLSIFVAGVTFEDGTIHKKLTRNDFDELGRLEIRFNRSGSAKTAVCHITEAYQGFDYVGTVKQLREEQQ